MAPSFSSLPHYCKITNCIGLKAIDQEKVNRPLPPFKNSFPVCFGRNRSNAQCVEEQEGSPRHAVGPGQERAQARKTAIPRPKKTTLPPCLQKRDCPSFTLRSSRRR